MPDIDMNEVREELRAAGIDPSILAYVPNGQMSTRGELVRAGELTAADIIAAELAPAPVLKVTTTTGTRGPGSMLTEEHDVEQHDDQDADTYMVVTVTSTTHHVLTAEEFAEYQRDALAGVAGKGPRGNVLTEHARWVSGNRAAERTVVAHPLTSDRAEDKVVTR